MIWRMQFKQKGQKVQRFLDKFSNFEGKEEVWGCLDEGVGYVDIWEEYFSRKEQWVFRLLGRES